MLGTIGPFVQDKNQYEKVTIVTHRDTHINTSFLRVDLGERYTKSRNAKIAESDQMGWYGVVPSSDTLWYSSWTLGAPGAELGHF